MVGISVRNNLIRKVTMIGVIICGAFSLLHQFVKIVGIARFKFNESGRFSKSDLSKTLIVTVYLGLSLARCILPMIVAFGILFKYETSDELVGASMFFIYISLVSNININ